MDNLAQATLDRCNVVVRHLCLLHVVVRIPSSVATMTGPSRASLTATQRTTCEKFKIGVVVFSSCVVGASSANNDVFALRRLVNSAAS